MGTSGMAADDMYDDQADYVQPAAGAGQARQRDVVRTERGCRSRRGQFLYCLDGHGLE